MTLENTGISRRKLLRTTAIGVPAAGMLAFGSTLVTAPAANAAMAVDGYWGTETTVELQKRLNSIAAVNSAVEGGLPLDGQIDSQLASQSSANPGLTSGWQWVSDDAASGSDTIKDLQRWLGTDVDGLIGPSTISALQSWLGQTADGVLDGPSPAIVAFQRKLIEGNYS
ncbi:MAG: peptidoglycan-binding protein [Rothia dentocariosa]